VQEDGIHVDLSQGFRTGGGTASMTGRVAQVLYTATSLDPDAPVWLSVEGKPIDSIGGEGLMLEQPLTRKRFKQDFSL
jgi:spore germination protein GerM